MQCVAALSELFKPIQYTVYAVILSGNRIQIKFQDAHRIFFSNCCIATVNASQSYHRNSPFELWPTVGNPVHD